MNYKVSVNKTEMKEVSAEIKKKLFSLNQMFLKSEEKVAYLYQSLDGVDTFSFNEDICFYTASVMKLFVVAIFYQKFILGSISKEEIITVEESDLKQRSGILKKRNVPFSISLEELCLLSIKYSDNTAYTKLVNFLGKDTIASIGKEIGATHTMEGKDSFGLINASDALLYLKFLNQLLIDYPNETKDLKTALLQPETKIVQTEDTYFRKYGNFDIAYHEVGIVSEIKPYYFICLTQKGNCKNKKQFIHKTYQIIKELNQLK